MLGMNSWGTGLSLKQSKTTAKFSFIELAGCWAIKADFVQKKEKKTPTFCKIVGG